MKKYYREIHEFYSKYRVNVFVTKMKNMEEYRKDIQDFWKFPEHVDFVEKIHYYLFEENPYCSHGYKRKFLSLPKGYHSENVNNCEECKQIIKEKIKNTNLKKYGVANPFSSDIVKSRIKETLMKKYGVENPSQNRNVHDKKKKTWLKRYGIDNPMKSEEIRNRARKKILEKYGVDNPTKSEKIKNRIKSTNLKKYGVYNTAKKHISNLDDWENFFPEIYEKFHGNEREISKYFNVNICSVQRRAVEYNLRKKYFSSYEVEIRKFLSERNLKTESRKRNILEKHEIDILIPEYGIGIEFHGLYWHSCCNQKDELYHYKKYIEAKNRNILLLQIFEDEWNFSKKRMKKTIRGFLDRNFFFLNMKSEKLLIDNRFHPGDEFLRQNDFVKLAEIPPKKWYTDYVTRKRRKFGNCKDVIFDAGYELWVKK